MDPGTLDAARLRRLIDAGRALVSQLDLDELLAQLIEIAAAITGARYVALGILDSERRELERFLTRGIGEEVRREIGDLPRGRGILGVLIEDPRPLRLASVGDDARSYGFPPAHPPMETFLGAPVMIRGQAWGNLYLTEKEGGAELTAADEESVVLLAEWAGIARENARLYQASERRRDELEASVRRLEATTAIARAIGGETDLDRVLELIVKRGRALVGARGMVILLAEEPGLVVAATAGEISPGFRGTRRDAGNGEAVRRSLAEHGLDAQVLVPLSFRGRTLGMLAAVGGERAEEDEQLLLAFAASAATAVATARSVEAQRLRESVAGAEAERARWARELHDETLQGLGGLRMLVSAARRRDDSDAMRAAFEEVVGTIDGEIEELAFEGRRSAEVETALYRIIQEALTNAVKHAGATRVAVEAREDDGVLRLSVRDDGRGFDPEAPGAGFGLAGMRERVLLLGGSLDVTSGPAGTRIEATLPAG